MTRQSFSSFRFYFYNWTILIILNGFLYYKFVKFVIAWLNVKVSHSRRHFSLSLPSNFEFTHPLVNRLGINGNAESSSFINCHSAARSVIVKVAIYNASWFFCEDYFLWLILSNYSNFSRCLCTLFWRRDWWRCWIAIWNQLK